MLATGALYNTHNVGIGFSDHPRGEQRVDLKCTSVFLGDVSVSVHVYI